MSITIVPWESYTWTSHVTSIRERIQKNEEEHKSLMRELDEANRELELAKELGIENQPLPSNYGENKVRMQQRSGMEGKKDE